MKFTIRRLESFEKLFKALSRKAVKLGLPAPSFVVTGERAEEATIYEINEDREPVKVGTEMVMVNDIEITGLEPVKLDGWNFVARLETVRGKDNLVYAVPGIEAPARFSTSGCVCEHCNVNRQRNNTYVVQHSDSGEFKQVGSTCLADFLGGNSPEALAALFAFYGEIVHDLTMLRDSEAAGWEGGNAAYDLRGVLALSIAVQDAHGWLGRGKAYQQGGTATADRVKLAKYGEYELNAEHYSKADEAIAYFANLPVTEDEQSLTRNARVLANAGYCSAKSHGLACALWVCYSVAKDKAAREARRAVQRENSKHVFTVGQRVKNIEATILSVFHYDTDFGRQTKTILEDRNGNVLVAKDLGFDFGNVRFTATVKEHTVYDGINQTSLLRATKIVPLDEAWNEEVEPATALVA